MNNKLLILFLVFAMHSFGQSKSARVGGIEFTFRTYFSGNENGDSIKHVAVYRGNTKQLDHIIRETSGDCNSEVAELGAFDIKDSTITFYTYWAKAGDAPTAPYGARKQIYKASKSGALMLTGSKLYIETTSRGWEQNKGIEYLFKRPTNDSEQMELAKYIAGVQNEYHATFVSGIERVHLLKEVKLRLHKEILRTTKYWKSHYSSMPGGVKT